MLCEEVSQILMARKYNSTPPPPPPPSHSAEMSLGYFIKNYVKPFNGKPNVLEVPFRELRRDGWKYRSGDTKFILAEVKESDEG
jgi:hypothetical protein